MPSHTQPCSDITNVSKELTQLHTEFTNHVSFDKQFQDEAKQEFHAIRNTLQEQGLVIGTLGLRIKDKVEDAMDGRMEKHERHEGMIYGKIEAALKSVDAKVDGLGDELKTLKNDGNSVIFKFMAAFIGILVPAFGAVLWHLLTDSGYG